MSDKTIIEVNGVKLEVDLRMAKRIDTLRVGDRVKVMKKKYDGYAVHPGVICGFEPFEKLPTIIVAYLEQDWSEAKLCFAYLNAETKETEIVKAIDEDRLALEKANVIALLDRAIAKKEEELEEIKRRKDFFLTNFAAYWEQVAPVVA